MGGGCQHGSGWCSLLELRGSRMHFFMRALEHASLIHVLRPRAFPLETQRPLQGREGGTAWHPRWTWQIEWMATRMVSRPCRITAPDTAGTCSMGPCPSHGPDYGTRHGRAHWSCTLQSMLAHHSSELGAHSIGPNSWLPSVYHCAALDRAPPVRNSSTMLARAHQAAEKPGILMMS